jgi:hypothetical protein
MVDRHVEISIRRIESETDQIIPYVRLVKDSVVSSIDYEEIREGCYVDVSIR